MTTTVSPTVTLSGSNVISTTSASSITLNSPIWNTTSDVYTINSNWPTGSSASGKISLQGEGADIEINGESLVAMLKRIEERVNLLSVNQELESEWEELRELGNQYRALEQRIKDKQATWAKLKAQDRDNR